MRLSCRTAKMQLFVPDQSLNETMLLSVMLPSPPSIKHPLLPIHIWCFPPPKPGREASLSPTLVRGGGVWRSESQMKAAGVTPLHSQSLENNIASESSTAGMTVALSLNRSHPVASGRTGKRRWGSTLSAEWSQLSKFNVRNSFFLWFRPVLLISLYNSSILCERTFYRDSMANSAALAQFLLLLRIRIKAFFLDHRLICVFS